MYSIFVIPNEHQYCAQYCHQYLLNHCLHSLLILQGPMHPLTLQIPNQIWSPIIPHTLHPIINLEAPASVVQLPAMLFIIKGQRARPNHRIHMRHGRKVLEQKLRHRKCLTDWRCGHTDAFKLGFVGFFFLLVLRDFTGI